MAWKRKTVILGILAFTLGFTVALALNTGFPPILFQTVVTEPSAGNFHAHTWGQAGWHARGIAGNMTPTWRLTGHVSHLMSFFPQVVVTRFSPPASFTHTITETSPGHFHIVIAGTAGYALILPPAVRPPSEHSRAVSLSFSLLISGARLIGSTRFSSASLTLSQTASRLATYPRSVSLQVGFSLDIARSASFNRAISQELGISSGTSRAAFLSRLLSQAVEFSQSAVRTAFFNRLLSQEVAFSQDISRKASFGRTASQELILSQDAIRSAFFNRLLSQTVGFSHETLRTAFFERILSQDIALSHEAARLTLFSRLLSQELGFSQDAGRTGDYARLPFQELTLSATAGRLGAFARGISQTVALIPAVVASLRAEFYAYPSLNIVMTPSADSLGEFFRRISAGVGFSTDTQRLLEAFRIPTLHVGLIPDLTAKLLGHFFAFPSLNLSVSSYAVSTKDVVPPPGGGFIVVSPPFLDITLRPTVFEGGWWKKSFTIPVEIINKGQTAADVIVSYEIRKQDTLVYSGTFTVFVSGLDRKMHVLEIPVLEDGNYTLTVETKAPVTAKASSLLIIRTPIYYTLPFFIVSVVLIVLLIVVILFITLHDDFERTIKKVDEKLEKVHFEWV